MTRVIVLLPNLDYFLCNFCINFHKPSLSKYSSKMDFRDKIVGGMFAFQSKQSGCTPRRCSLYLCLPLLKTLGKRG